MSPGNAKSSRDGGRDKMEVGLRDERVKEDFRKYLEDQPNRNGFHLFIALYDKKDPDDRMKYVRENVEGIAADAFSPNELQKQLKTMLEEFYKSFNAK